MLMLREEANTSSLEKAHLTLESKKTKTKKTKKKNEKEVKDSLYKYQ